MHLIPTVIRTLLVLLCCEWCAPIKVPVWRHGERNKDSVEDNSDVVENVASEQSEFAVDSFVPSNVYRDDASSVPVQPIPVEYFEYTAKKPQFAVDVATFHGVNNPEKHFRASPIRPYTGDEKPNLGKHRINNKDNLYYEPFEQYSIRPAALKASVTPVSISNYEIFHPYKDEEPALKAIYKDPTLQKIRNDIRNNKNRLQKYENDAGEPNISKGEYLKTPDELDKERFPHRNEATEFEVHHPQRQPVYYKRPYKNNRNNYLNKRFKNPWNQNHIKIRPANYRPLQTHIHKLRQHQAQTYDDEHNEYPQVKPVDNISDQEELPDGYDIYEKGKEKYVHLRNNVDNAINGAVLENRPHSYQNLELQNNKQSNEEEIDDEEEKEFVPVKNYAQVRKTETTKHLPREAALEEAVNDDEIENAPRLREAIKSTKAQTVYTEEGYEDSAYDHAGEQKHASDHEDHGGYLKENEKSAGKFKTPSFSGSYEDSNGSNYGDSVQHGEKWKNDGKDSKEQLYNEDYNEYDESIDSDAIVDKSAEENINDEKQYNDDGDSTNEHELNKREANFKVPEISLDNTYLTEKEILAISKEKIQKPKDNFDFKYPYYKELSGELSKNSPLRYAENLKFIPKKTNGGTEFYDSRSKLVCAEVDEDNVDPIPQNVKEAEQNDKQNQNSKRKKREANFNQTKAQPRLKGLGDKIDCFKAKYFGNNPLDSPFFKEDIIVNPEPISIPQIHTLTLNKVPEINVQESRSNNVYSGAEKLREENHKDIFNLIEKLKQNRFQLQNRFSNPNNNFTMFPFNQLINETLQNDTYNKEQSNVYIDVVQNIRNNNNLQKPQSSNNEQILSNLLGDKVQNTTNNDNITYSSFNNKEDVKKILTTQRRKRSTSFIYEPYKVIRDNHANESKKTTTSTNVSPLIKQLQSSRVVDIVPSILGDGRKKDKIQLVKRNVKTKSYKDIRKEDREKNNDKGDEQPRFVDVSLDKRRGEPRYEMIHLNHKENYEPVENKTSMSLNDYKAHSKKAEDNNKDANEKENIELNNKPAQISERLKIRKPTARPYFDVSQYLPKAIELQQYQQPSASKNVRMVIRTTTPSTENQEDEEALTQNDTKEDEVETDEDYEEDEEDEEEEEENTTTTTSTTTTIRSPLRIRRPRTSTTTHQPNDIYVTTAQPKLRLVTRFRSSPREQNQIKISTKQEQIDDDDDLPKLTEKSKKSSKSTLVTDSKTYGEGNDDMKKDEIDAMIGIRHNMDDYIPEYEKQEEKSENKEQTKSESIESSENNSQAENDEDDYEDDDDEDEDENDYDDNDDEEEEDEEDVEDDREVEKDTENSKKKSELRSEKYTKPLVSTKKIEIHKELPINKSSPHIIQFKQDITEEETVKKIPSKNLEALDFYRDDNLPDQINKLQDVEVFKADLKLNGSPKHGGNYRSITDADIKEQKEAEILNNKKNADAETSQSKNAKLIELNEQYSPRQIHRGNLKLHSTKTSTAKPVRLRRPIRRRQESQKSAKLELEENVDDDVDRTKMHGGNLKSAEPSTPHTKINRQSNNNRNAKIIELDESIEPLPIMHGGNLRSRSQNAFARNKGADLLNSFAQAVPILTTTPAYILDPSKRMYYYVDT